MIWLFVKLILGLALILLGANWLIDGSSSIARKFGISEFVVGMTIVGIGTSTPEMVVSFISSIQGNSDIAVGNIVGSNLANTFLILGLVSLASPIALTKSNIKQISLLLLPLPSFSSYLHLTPTCSVRQSILFLDGMAPFFLFASLHLCFSRSRLPKSRTRYYTRTNLSSSHSQKNLRYPKHIYL